MDKPTRIWFITDIHGSNLCFRKFLNVVKTAKRPDAIIIGGDITGKYIVPVVQTDPHHFSAQFEGKSQVLTDDEVADFETRLGDKGAYPFRCDHDAARRLTFDEGYIAQITRELQVERLKAWVKLADEKMLGSECKIFINAGNDDQFYVDEVLDSSKTIVRPEGKAVDIDPYLQMISLGYSSPTPWDCPRDRKEPELKRLIEQMLPQVKKYSRCIFNMHCPPHDTPLDLAPKLDDSLRPIIGPLGQEMAHVGSTSVREAIARLQPPLTLHGHIHEQYCHTTIGKTRCFNPGSEYSAGTLRGVYAVFNQGELKAAELTREEVGSDDSEVSERGLAGLIKATPFIGYALHEMLFRRREDDALKKRVGSMEEKLDRLLSRDPESKK